MNKEINWTVGRSYDENELQPAMTMTALEFVEQIGVYHIYKGKDGRNRDKYFVSFNNQPDIRHLIRDYKHSIFGIGFFEAYSGYFAYEVPLSNGQTVTAKTIARITVMIPGNKDHKRTITADPSGIIVK
ncbi:hypothetical protein D3C81_1474770 [compost metagenome]